MPTVPRASHLGAVLQLAPLRYHGPPPVTPSGPGNTVRKISISIGYIVNFSFRKAHGWWTVPHLATTRVQYVLQVAPLFCPRHDAAPAAGLQVFVEKTLRTRGTYNLESVPTATCPRTGPLPLALYSGWPRGTDSPRSPRYARWPRGSRAARSAGRGRNCRISPSPTGERAGGQNARASSVMRHYYSSWPHP